MSADKGEPVTNQLEQPSAVATSEGQAQGHPVAFRYFFFGEFAERCSYYGMRAILPLYLTNALHFSDATGGTLYYWFKMACYALPLLGGFLADRYFGKYRTIVGFSIPYVLGHFVLGIESTTAAVIALALLAGGSGVIKPNISTLLGLTYDQQRPGQTQLRSAAFMWFYFAINVGALISTVALPMLRDKYGYAVAFQFPAWLMVISLGVFAAGKKHYATETIEYRPPTAAEKKDRAATLRRLFGVFTLMTLFWVPYEHNDSIWVFFSRDYVNLNVPMTSVSLAPDQLQFLNPLCVMIFAPLFAWLFPKIDPNVRFFSDKMKILLGFVCGTLSSAIMTGAGYLANPDVKISMMWVVSAYVLLTIAEVLVYGTGLDLAFSEAPANMKGFVTGCFLLTTTLANFFNSIWVKYYGGSLNAEAAGQQTLAPGPFFGLSGLFVVVAMFAMLVMMLTAKPKPQSEQVDED